MKDEIKEMNLSEMLFNRDERLLDHITNLQEEVKSANESITWWQNRFNALHKENERLLKTQEMYEKKCNKIHNYILQNCEIIRHKDYDEVGKVNGGHILTLLAGGDDNE